MPIAFLSEVAKFLARHGMRPTELGVRALNDGGFVRELQRGRMPRVDTVERVRAWMRAYAVVNPPAPKTARKKSAKAAGKRREAPVDVVARHKAAGR